MKDIMKQMLFPNLAETRINQKLKKKWKLLKKKFDKQK